jgi:hypothetical protein
VRYLLFHDQQGIILLYNVFEKGWFYKMLEKIDDSVLRGFVQIAETYADSYILVKIAEIDHSKGRETGWAMYVSPSRDALVSLAKRENISTETVILQGENLLPMFGGIL